MAASSRRWRVLVRWLCAAIAALATLFAVLNARMGWASPDSAASPIVARHAGANRIAAIVLGLVAILALWGAVELRKTSRDDR